MRPTRYSLPTNLVLAETAPRKPESASPSLAATFAPPRFRPRSRWVRLMDRPPPAGSPEAATQS